MNDFLLSIAVPAYNEQARILATLEQMADYYSKQSYRWEATIVSDGSTDRTVELVENFIEGRPEFRLDAYAPNRGKGYAVRRGMLAARGEIALFMDADLATPLSQTEVLLPRILGGSDVVIGSRPLKGSNLTRHQPKYRELLGRVANALVQTLAVKGIQDTQCGFKMFTATANQDIFSRCKMDRFSFDFEALMIARDLGYAIDEVGIEWAHQEGSKVVFWRDYPRSLRDLVALRLMGKARRIALNATD